MLVVKEKSLVDDGFIYPVTKIIMNVLFTKFQLKEEDVVAQRDNQENHKQNQQQQQNQFNSLMDIDLCMIKDMLEARGVLEQVAK